MELTHGKYHFGRWGLCIISWIKRSTLIPTLNTFAAIAFMGLTAVIIIKLLKIKRPVSIIIASAILITAPTFADSLIYNYCSDSYAIAMFLSALSVYYIYNKKALMYFIISSFCVAVVMSIYQAYIGVFVGLCVIVPILEVLRNERELKKIWIDILKSIVMVVVGVIIYYIISQIFLKIYNVSLASYSGANKIGLNIFKTMPEAFVQTYKSFYIFLFKDSILKNAYWKRNYINILFLVLLIVSYILAIIRHKTYKNPIRIITIIIFSLLLPVALDLIELIAQERTVNILMTPAFYLIYILLIAVLESLNNNLKESVVKWMVISELILIIVTYVLSDQYTYKARQLIYEQTYFATTQIINNIKLNEEYKKDMSICFAGTINQKASKDLIKVKELAIGHCSDLNEVFDDYNSSRTNMRIFISQYCGMDVKWCTTEEYNSIVSSQEFKEMGVYPEKNSIKVINDIMVVKLANNPPKP